MNKLITTAGQLARADLPQFDALAGRFLATLRSDRTRNTYGRALTTYQRSAAANNLDPLKADAVIAYSNELQQARLANDTKRIRLKAVQSFFAWCYTFNLSPLKPEQVSRLITMPPARKLSPRDILTEHEARRLLAATSGRDRVLIRVMLDAGLRVSEAVALLADDVYPASDRYYIHVAHGKGDKSRDVEIPADLYHELKALGDSRLFRLNRVTAWRIIERAAAGLDKAISPHSLRHTHAHQLRLLGWPLEMIADRLGHSSLETTKIYTRPAELAQQIRLPLMPWGE